MATKKAVIVDIDPQGNITIEAEGYSGGSCRLETEALEEALGTVKERKVTGGECDVKNVVRAGKR